MTSNFQHCLGQGGISLGFEIAGIGAVHNLLNILVLWQYLQELLADLWRCALLF